MRRLIIIPALLLCSCGQEPSSSFSRLRNYKIHKLTKKVNIGDSHVCAILAGSGTLKCWGGNNQHGQLGGENPDNRGRVTVSLPSGRSVLEVGVGTDHTCAILDDDSLHCWGNNQYGQLGNGKTGKVNGTVAVSLGENRTAKMVQAGNGHTCAILDDDSLKCWGRNHEGQVGINSSTTVQTSPINISLGGSDKTAKMIALGSHHTCAILKDDNTLKCWGFNQSGQIGDGSTDSRAAPTAINLGENRTALAVDAGGEHTCAILDNKNLICWGLNDKGQLGDGGSTNLPSPHLAVSVSLSSFPDSISLGHKHSCVLLINGSPFCWGDNDHHQLGDGNTSPSSLPVTPALGSNATARTISAGSQNTCAIMEDDSLVCWGDNTSDILGSEIDKKAHAPTTIQL